MPWLGLDIGGANLKVARPDGTCEQLPFPLWQRRGELAHQLATILKSSPTDLNVAVTMTGELADCFANKAEGVAAIVDAVVDAAGERRCQFYGTDGGWHDAATAGANPLTAAASNWHALATFASRFSPERAGFLVDIGSTTTDIIPVEFGRPIESQLTDFDRLKRSQLVYTGVTRSSLIGLVNEIQTDGQPIRLANEFFATIQDAYVWLGKIQGNQEDCNTADGRPMTRPFAGQRIARMLCSDLSELDETVIDTIAAAAEQANRHIMGNAMTTVFNQHRNLPRVAVLSGQGAWLAEEVIRQVTDDHFQIVRLRDEIGDMASQAAAAWAVAKLAADEY